MIEKKRRNDLQFIIDWEIFKWKQGRLSCFFLSFKPTKTINNKLGYARSCWNVCATVYVCRMSNFSISRLISNKQKNWQKKKRKMTHFKFKFSIKIHSIFFLSKMIKILFSFILFHSFFFFLNNISSEIITGFI